LSLTESADLTANAYRLIKSSYIPLQESADFFSPYTFSRISQANFVESADLTLFSSRTAFSPLSLIESADLFATYQVSAIVPHSVIFMTNSYYDVQLVRGVAKTIVFSESSDLSSLGIKLLSGLPLLIENADFTATTIRGVTNLTFNLGESADLFIKSNLTGLTLLSEGIQFVGIADLEISPGIIIPITFTLSENADFNCQFISSTAVPAHIGICKIYLKSLNIVNLYLKSYGGKV